MKLVFDIETDDLKATRIWCIVAKDVDTEQVYTFGPDQIEELVSSSVATSLSLPVSLSNTS